MGRCAGPNDVTPPTLIGPDGLSRHKGVLRVRSNSTDRELPRPDVGSAKRNSSRVQQRRREDMIFRQRNELVSAMR